MNNLPIHLTTHHLRLSDALRKFVLNKIAPVNRFANDALSAEIVLRRHGGAKTRFSASGRVALPGRDVYGRAVDEDLYVAIGQLVATLGRRLRKRKTRLGRTHERSTPERVSRSSLLRVDRDFATRSYGPSPGSADRKAEGVPHAIFDDRWQEPSELGEFQLSRVGETSPEKGRQMLAVLSAKRAHSGEIATGHGR